MPGWGKSVTFAGHLLSSAGQGIGEDPKDIIRDAENPAIPAELVLLRARARSRIGKLVEAVQRIIDQHETGISDSVQQVAELADFLVDRKGRRAWAGWPPNRLLLST